MSRARAALAIFSLLVPFLPHPAAGMWVSGFYVGYGSSSYPPSAIDFSSLTHVSMFSVLPRSDGSLDTNMFLDPTSGPALARDVAQRAHAAGKKAILVVGGAGTGNAIRSAASSANRAFFVQNLVQTGTSWGYDGIDVDWEPLPSSDYANMLALMSDLRAAWPGAILAADIGWGLPSGTADKQFYVQLAGAVDQLNVMTYSMADSWPGWVSWHASAIHGDGADHPSSVNREVTTLLNAGVQPAKIGFGIGFYGACWAPPVTAPLQSPNGSFVKADDNTMSFANIKTQYYTASAYRYDSIADAPYLTFASATGPQGCTFISYEDETSVAAKADYARQKGLGGTIIWQINEGYTPTASDPNAMLHAVGSAFLGGGQPAAPTSTSVTSSVQPSAVGQPVTFTATVTSAAGVPGGTVTFRDGATTLGSASLASGSAALTTSTLSAGSHAITAAYSGATGFAASTSPSLTQTVQQSASSTALASSVNPTVFGQATTLTATVTASSGVPTGTVTFQEGSVTLGSAAISAGKATLALSSLTVGSHSLVAVYGGSANHAGSTSATMTQVVNKANTTTTLTSSRNPAKVRQSVTFTAKVAVAAPGTGSPAGTVRFFDGGVQIGSATISKGAASFSTSALTSGNHAITAVYDGAASYQSSTSPVLTQTIR